MRDTIEMAREAGLLTWLKPPEDVIERFKAFEALVRADERKIVINEPLTKEMWQRFEDEIRADEREACAKVAGWLHQQYTDTKDAHERLSPAPFRPSRFGFDESTVQQSKRMMDAIRARGETK